MPPAHAIGSADNSCHGVYRAMLIGMPLFTASSLRARFDPQLKGSALAFCAGLGFLAVFQLALRNVPTTWYISRDDGLITLSHARNLVEYGFVGVNPSGERVEGFSAPLQFLIYAAAYAATHVGYATFLSAQTLLCTALLGAGVFRFLCATGALPSVALAGSWIGAVLLQSCGTFLLWHHSGMENAITHCCMVWLIALLVEVQAGRPPSAALPFVAFATSISRIDAVFFVAPVLALAVLFARRAMLTPALLWGAAWAAFFGLRVWYFGAWQPNTAAAQGISVGATLVEWLLGERDRQAEAALAQVLARNPLLLLMLTAPLVAVARRDARLLPAIATCALVVVLSLLHPLVFGEARLDPARLTSFMAPVAICLTLAVILSTQWPAVLRLAIAAACVLPPLSAVLPYERYEICCSATGVEKVRTEFGALATDHRLARPLVANADLGAVSFAKEFNVLDLGRLGSDVLAHVRSPREAGEWFFELAAPDIIEIHEFWWVRNAFLFRDPRFRQRYIPVEEHEDVWFARNAPSFPDARDGIYMRRDMMRDSGTAERRLHDRMAGAPSIEAIGLELKTCDRHGSYDCLYVLRTAYRFLPELSARQHDLEALFSAVSNARFREWALAVLRSRRDGRLSGAVMAWASGARQGS